MTAVELAALARALRGRGLAWLDGDGSPGLGGRSFLAFDPIETRAVRFDAEGPLALDLSGGPWIGALAYDLAWSAPARLGLRAPRALARGPSSLVASFARHRAIVAVDHERGAATIVEGGEGVRAELEQLLATSPSCTARVGALVAEPAAVHRAAIVQALEAIGRGDLYQVNLARRWTARIDGDPLALYLAMRRASPVPLGAYLELADGTTLLSRSMERFLSFDARSRTIETRPIKGTTAHDPQGAPAGDLRASAKEHAEHAMIVDLMRNDLSRVAEPGTVRVADPFRVEPYARLSHLVSVVEGRVKAGALASTILAATFPPGSVTGAPKLAAMEHVERLERFPRGFYTGAIGMIGRDGSLSFSVAIRTAHVRAGELEYFAGGGIVEASDPDAEVAETDLKAKVLEDAIAILHGDGG